MKKSKKVRKAVIPAAGLGTRFLPVTKSIPKEMTPIVDKPAIQFVVEEAVASGIEEILIVTGKFKRSVEDHFDSNPTLERNLEEKGKDTLLKIVKDITNARVCFTRQPYPYGLGDAVLRAKAFVGNEPFVVMLGDNVMVDEIPLTKQLIDSFEESNASTISVMPIDKEQSSSFGMIKPERTAGPGLHNVSHFVEKPSPEDAPSNLGIIGRYVLTPEIFDILQEQEIGKDGEIHLTDAIDTLNKTQRVFAKEFHGERYDIGDKNGYMKTSIQYGLVHPEVKDDFKRYLIELAEKLKNGEEITSKLINTDGVLKSAKKGK